MSINYCTLASNTVDSFCSPRRGIVFAKLVSELHPVVPPNPVSNGGSVWSIRDTSARRILGSRYDELTRDQDEKPILTFEQPQVTVQVEILGFSGSETLDVTRSQLDFVSITDLDLGGLGDADSASIVVNIFDLNI